MGFSVTRWGNHGQTTTEGNGDRWAELVSRTVRLKDFGQSVDSFQNGWFRCEPLSGPDGVTVRAGRGGSAGGPRPGEGSSHECWGAGFERGRYDVPSSSRRTGCPGGSSGGPAFATSSRSQCRYRSLISCFMPGRSSVRWAARSCPGSWGSVWRRCHTWRGRSTSPGPAAALPAAVRWLCRLGSAEG